MAGILVDMEDLAAANKTVKSWFEKTYGINVENAKGGSGGGGKASGGGGGGKKESKKTPMEELVARCGELVQTPEGTSRLEMALQMMDLEKASECPEDKIPKLMAMIAEK